MRWISRFLGSEQPTSAVEPLDASARWTTPLHGSIGHSVYLSPATRSVYVSDGFGSTMRIRRHDLATGDDVASVRSFLGFRCATILDGGASLLAVLDNRLLELDAFTLEERGRWDRRIPRYGDTVTVVDRQAVFANWAKPSVGIVDLATGKARHRTAPEMTQVLGGRPRPLLVGGSKRGGTSELELPAATVHELLRTPPALHAALAPDGERLVLLAGIRGTITSDSSSRGGPSADLRIYRLDGGPAEQHRLPTAVSAIACGARQLLLGGQSVVLSAQLPLDGSTFAMWRAPERRHQVVAMDADTGLVLTLVSGSRSTPAELTCWQLDRSSPTGRRPG